MSRLNNKPELKGEGLKKDTPERCLAEPWCDWFPAHRGVLRGGELPGPACRALPAELPGCAAGHPWLQRSCCSRDPGGEGNWQKDTALVKGLLASRVCGEL